MTVTLNLPLHVEQAFLAEAKAKGLSPDDLVRDVLVARQPGPTPAGLDPEQWIRQFRAWVASHAKDDLPVLSDEAISRESIYRDRGL